MIKFTRKVVDKCKYFLLITMVVFITAFFAYNNINSFASSSTIYLKINPNGGKYNGSTWNQFIGVHVHDGDEETDGDCYDPIYHVHDESCYTTHTHGEGCYAACYAQEGVIISNMEGDGMFTIRCDECGGTYRNFVEGGAYGVHVPNCNPGHDRLTCSIPNRVLSCTYKDSPDGTVITGYTKTCALDDFVAITNPTRTGYDFAGWTSNNSFNTYDNAGTTYWKGNVATTLTANYTPKTYTNTIQYDLNGGNGTISDMTETVTYPNTKGTLEFPSATPTRTGYTFKGWFSSYDPGTQYNSPSDFFQDDYAGDQTKKVIAQWTRNTYTITYNMGIANGGTIPEPQSVKYTERVQSPGAVFVRDNILREGQQIVYNMGSASSGTLPETQKLYNCYTQKGWSLNPDGSTNDHDLESNIVYNYDHNIDLYPYFSWLPTNKKVQIAENNLVKDDVLFPVTFNYNDGVTDNYISNVILRYTPDGWSLNSMGSYKDFDAGYETTNAYSLYPHFTSERIPAVFPSTPTRPGYTFKEWNNRANGKGTAYTSYDEYLEKTLYAIWEPKTYTNTLKYNVDGASETISDMTNTVTYPNTKSTFNITATIPTKEGYDFFGWYDSPSGKTKYTTTCDVGDNNITSNQEKTLYARFYLHNDVDKFEIPVSMNPSIESTETTTSDTITLTYDLSDIELMDGWTLDTLINNLTITKDIDGVKTNIKSNTDIVTITKDETGTNNKVIVTVDTKTLIDESNRNGVTISFDLPRDVLLNSENIKNKELSNSIKVLRTLNDSDIIIKHNGNILDHIGTINKAYENDTFEVLLKDTIEGTITYDQIGLTPNNVITSALYRFTNFILSKTNWASSIPFDIEFKIRTIQDVIDDINNIITSDIPDNEKKDKLKDIIGNKKDLELFKPSLTDDDIDFIINNRDDIISEFVKDKTPVSDADDLVSRLKDAIEKVKANKTPSKRKKKIEIKTEDVIKDEKGKEKVVTHVSYIEGYTDGTIKPDGTMTRGEISSLISHISKTYDNNENYEDNAKKFKDANPNSWYINYIGYLSKEEIYEGYTDNNVKPNNDITRGELCKTICALLDIDVDETNKNNKHVFEDSKNRWYEKYVNALWEKGYIDGYGDGTFRGDRNITRAEVCKILNRALNREIKNSNTITEEERKEFESKFSDVKDKWYYYDLYEATMSY